MKKILSLILTAAMLLSAVVMTAGAENIGEGTYAPMAPSYDESSLTKALDENQVDAQGIYYSLDSESKTAIVGKNTYADTASADAGLTTDSIVIPQTVIFGEEEYTVVAIGRNAFDGTAVREVAVTDSVASIGEFAFAGCTSLETVLAFKVTEIKGFAFWGCTALNLIYITDADSIGGGAFWNCSNLQNITLDASTIMEKAFEGCDSLEYIVFLGDAPAVAAGAIDTADKAYINDGAIGYDEFPVATEVLSSYIIDVEDVYAKAGETVEVAVNVPAGFDLDDVHFAADIALADGLSVTSVISSTSANTNLLDAEYIDGTLYGQLASSFAGTLAILKVKVADDAAAGTYEITASGLAVEGANCIAGSITICDHADTKTVTVKAASCDEPGTENTVCTACGEVISSADVDAKGHSYTDFVIAPTCTEGGYTRHICDCCSDAYTDSELEALGHSWDEGKVKVEPSTSKEGLVTYTCTTCGTTMDVKLPKILYGDANNDTKVNISDASTMLKYLAKWTLAEDAFNETNADVNCDSKINLGDASLLLKYLAKWDVVIGPQK